MSSRPRLEFRVLAIIEDRESGARIRESEIRRSMFDAGLVADLERYWRITRELATINDHAIAKLTLTSHDGARSVMLRDPPFDTAPDASDPTRATTIFEALRKLTQS